MSDSVRPHRQQPTRLPRPWDSPGKNTGVGCHFLLPRNARVLQIRREKKKKKTPEKENKSGSAQMVKSKMKYF